MPIQSHATQAALYLMLLCAATECVNVDYRMNKADRELHGCRSCHGSPRDDQVTPCRHICRPPRLFCETYTTLSPMQHELYAAINFSCLEVKGQGEICSILFDLRLYNQVMR